jgi:restriction system protein
MAIYVCRNPIGLGEKFWADRERGFVAIGFSFFSDMDKLKSRDAIKKILAANDPGANKWKIANHAGQLWRFSKEIKDGDSILSPDRNEPIIHVGRVVGNYRYNSKNLDGLCPHIRDVKWIVDLRRAVISQGALYEIGCQLTVYQVTTHADEINALISKTISGPKPEQDVPAIGDEEEGIGTDRVTELTTDFVLKRLEKYYKGIPLEGLTANLMEAMGYKTRHRDRPGPDGGKDVIAHPDEFGFHSPVIRIEVKSHVGQAGGPAVQKLIGGMNSGEFALFISLGGFNQEAKMAAAGRGNVRLIDGPEFVKLIYTYYDQLDAEHKSRIPLQRVFAPDIGEEN